MKSHSVGWFCYLSAGCNYSVWTLLHSEMKTEEESAGVKGPTQKHCAPQQHRLTSHEEREPDLLSL